MCVRCYLHGLISASLQPYEVGVIISTILLMKKQRLNRVKYIIKTAQKTCNRGRVKRKTCREGQACILCHSPVHQAVFVSDISLLGSVPRRGVAGYKNRRCSPVFDIND